MADPSEAMTTEPSEKSQSTVKRFLSYVLPHKKLAFVAVIGMMGYAAVDTFVFSQLQPLVDDSLQSGNYSYLRIASYAIIPLFLLRGICNFMGAYTLEYLGTQVVMKMRQSLFEKYIHLPISFHDKHSSGSLMSKILYDTEQVRFASGKALATLVREGMFVVGLLVVMFYYSWQLSLIFLVVGPIVGVIVSAVSKRFRSVSNAIQEAMGSLTSSIEQAIKGHKVVLMFDGQKLESDKFAEQNNHNRQQNMKLVSSRILSVSTIQVIASIALAAVLYVSSLPDFIEGLTAGVFLNVVVCMVMLLKPLKQLTTVNSEFQKGMTACASVFEILDQHDEPDTGDKEIERVAGKLSIKELSFAYPGKQENALTDINVEASPGQTIALVGRSGSGKSTLSSLLTRFYQADEGQILIDDVKIEALTLRSLRHQFALVSQQVVLFNDTIANNIAYGQLGKVSREEIIKAADTAHVTSFVENLEAGFDTIIGENGLMLSGGQRQRLAIARAILADAPILILDEATSALDTESEKYIQKALEQLQKSRTSIVVAHRLSTIESADQILVMDHGKIVERGTHTELLSKQGMYAQLHALQFSSDAN